MKIRAIFLSTFVFFLFAGEALSGAWTLPKGRLWAKSAVFYHSTDSRFCTEQDALGPAFQEVGCTSAGDSGPFDPFLGGEFTALSVFTEVMYGATGWLDVGLQIPFYSLKFTDDASPNRPRSNSIGDIRVYGKLRLLQAPLVASIQIGAKSPTGKHDIDAEVVNVSEGQWDLGVMAEFSRSLWPWPGYAGVGLGYRIRADNEEFPLTMADEFMATAEAGYSITPQVMIKGVFDWLRGGRPELKLTGIEVLERRELRTLTPSLIYMPEEHTQLEAGIRVPLGGQDFPDGPQLSASVSYSLSPWTMDDGP